MNSYVTACPFYLCHWSLNELMANITDKEPATYTVQLHYIENLFYSDACSIVVYKLVLAKPMRPICSLYSTQILTKNEASMQSCQPLPRTFSRFSKWLLSAMKWAIPCDKRCIQRNFLKQIILLFFNCYMSTLPFR